MNSDNKVYVIIVKGKWAPKEFHTDLIEARKEAMRLCKLEWRPTYIASIEEWYETSVFLTSIIDLKW